MSGTLDVSTEKGAGTKDSKVMTQNTSKLTDQSMTSNKKIEMNKNEVKNWKQNIEQTRPGNSEITLNENKVEQWTQDLTQ